MSRSSKGFADFFPTAPSVLQQKRSKASEDRERYFATATTSLRNSHAASAPRLSSRGDREREIHTKRMKDGISDTSTKILSQEESEYTNGDASQEIGSASSTSTTSSVFSASRKDGNIANHNGLHNPTTLTPLTNMDSSPRANGMNSPPKTNSNDKHPTAKYNQRSPISGRVEENVGARMEEASTPESLSSECATLISGPRARPGVGEVKGYKIVFDPDADRTLKGKEKRNRTAEYKAFGEGVRFNALTHL